MKAGSSSALRWTVFALVAATLFWAALSNDVYNLTSPPAFGLHVLLRKSYSIVAFAVVGVALIWASKASLRTTAVAIAIYSGLIEIGQHILYGHEPLFWNAIDVACGAVGGALAGANPWIRVRSNANISAAQTQRPLPPA